MAVTAQSVIDRVQATLQDTTGIRWPVVGELVLWINDAQREIALFKPDASAVNSTKVLEAGTKQSIPTDGNRLLRCVRNMSAASAGTGGRAVRIVSREILDAQSPDWHDPTVTGDAAHGTVVKHYIYDEANPRNFYVYPGIAVATPVVGWLEIIYSANPGAVVQNGNLTIPDIWANAVMDYVLYRAYSKDAEYAANLQRTGQHYGLFMSSVTGKAAVDFITSPYQDAQTGQAVTPRAPAQAAVGQ